MKTTINQRLAMYLDYMRISQADYTKALAVRKQQVSDWLASKIEIPDKHIVKTIETYSELNARWFITGDGVMTEDEGIKRIMDEIKMESTVSDDYVELLKKTIADKDREIISKERELERVWSLLNEQTVKKQLAM